MLNPLSHCLWSECKWNEPAAQNWINDQMCINAFLIWILSFYFYAWIFFKYVIVMFKNNIKIIYVNISLQFVVEHSRLKWKLVNGLLFPFNYSEYEFISNEFSHICSLFGCLIVLLVWSCCRPATDSGLLLLFAHANFKTVLLWRFQHMFIPISAATEESVIPSQVWIMNELWTLAAMHSICDYALTPGHKLTLWPAHCHTPAIQKYQTLS